MVKQLLHNEHAYTITGAISTNHLLEHAKHFHWLLQMNRNEY